MTIFFLVKHFLQYNEASEQFLKKSVRPKKFLSKNHVYNFFKSSHILHCTIKKCFSKIKNGSPNPFSTLISLNPKYPPHLNPTGAIATAMTSFSDQFLDVWLLLDILDTKFSFQKILCLQKSIQFIHPQHLYNLCGATLNVYSTHNKL